MGKIRTLLWITTAITTSTAVTTVLTSCSVANQNIINDTCGWDATYGINDATYKRMEEDFEILYKSQLDKKLDDGDIKEDEYFSLVNDFNIQLASFHKALNSDQNKTLSYTLRTEALQSLARKKYNIYLNRSYFNISISDFHNQLNSYLTFLKVYFKSIKCDSTLADDLYTKTKTYGYKFINELIKEGKDLPIEMRNFQEGLAIVSMSDVNSKISEYEASRQLSSFFENNSIISLKSVDSESTWDKLYINPFFNTKNADISPYINKILRITHKDDNGDEVSTPFSNDIIPGYILTPKMNEMKSEPEKNIYKIDIDWEISRAGIHKFYDDANLYDFQYKTTYPTEHEFPISAKYELEQLKEVYLDRINLCWDDASNCAKEEFFTPNNSEYVENDLRSLARAGLKMNDIRLDSLLDDSFFDIYGSNNDYQLLKDFISNCTLFAKTNVFYDDSNLLSSVFYVGFLHSYSADENVEKEQKYGHRIFAWQHIINCDMLVSNSFYKNAVTYYNNVLQSQIISFSDSIIMSESALETASYIEYIYIGINVLMIALMVAALTTFIMSFGIDVCQLVTAIIISIQLIVMSLALSFVLGTTAVVTGTIKKFKEFAKTAGLNIETRSKYPKITADTPTSKSSSSESDIPFIKRIQNDHFIFETRKEFSKTHGDITPYDSFNYYKNIDTNPLEVVDTDYQQYLDLRKKFKVSEDNIVNNWLSNLEKNVDEKTGKISYTPRQSILDHFMSALFMMQTLNDCTNVAMIMIACAEGKAALVAQKGAMKLVAISFLSLMVNVALTIYIPKIIDWVISMIL